MAGFYNKDELKEKLELENVFDLLVELGAEPQLIENGIISRTICHNVAGEGSHKLYYYSNSKLFKCYTSCDDTFDIFELVIKAMKNQRNEDWELYDAMVYIASFFGFAESARPTDNIQTEHWVVFKRHDFSLPQLQTPIMLKEYNPIILTRFSYPRIVPWEKENISSEVCKKNLIGYYPGKDQITIPHFDINNRLIGIRGRFLAEEDADKYG